MLLTVLQIAEISLLRVEADKFREDKKMLLQRREDDQSRMDNMLTRIKILEEERDKVMTMSNMSKTVLASLFLCTVSEVVPAMM